MDIEQLRHQLVGTTIDPETFLSTDYFNSFNEVIMLLGMLGDVPEVIEDIDAWEFRSYEQHFDASGLPFADVAIEAYRQAPVEIRIPFDETIVQLNDMVEMARDELAAATLLPRDAETPEDETGGASASDHLAEIASVYSMQLQQLVETGSAIIHGAENSSVQDAVDALF